MPLNETRQRLTPEVRATLFYFTMYMTSGAATVYAGIWFQQKGLNSTEIGVVNALPVFIMLAINLFVGRIADKADDWRQVIVLGAVLSGILGAALFFAEGFWGILLVWTLIALPISAVGPVSDAATMRMTRRNGTDYGFIRAWGTVGYTATIAITGYIVTWFGSAVFLPFLVFLGLLRAVVSLLLPKFRAAHSDQHVAPAVTGATHLLQVMKPWFLLPLVGWSMVFSTHLILNAFQGLLWKEQGIPEDIIGPLIALGAVAEATMMFVFARFAKRFAARHLILLSGAVSVLRWIAMGFSPPAPVLIMLQCFHAITFAMGFMGCVHFIANWTGETIAAEAQSFFNMLQQGMSVIALVAFGWLVGLMGAHAYFVAAGFALLGSVLIWSSLRLHPKTATAAMG